MVHKDCKDKRNKDILKGHSFLSRQLQTIDHIIDTLYLFG